MKQKKVKSTFLEGISVFNQVNSHKQYVNDPFGTISTHIENKMLIEAMKTEQPLNHCDYNQFICNFMKKKMSSKQASHDAFHEKEIYKHCCYVEALQYFINLIIHETFKILLGVLSSLPVCKMNSTITINYMKKTTSRINNVYILFKQMCICKTDKYLIRNSLNVIKTRF